MVGGDNQIMPCPHLAQRRPGADGIDFAQIVVFRLTALAVVHQNGAEGQTEPDVVVIHEFLCLLLGHLHILIAKEQVAVRVDVAGICFVCVHVAHRIFIHHNAVIVEFIEVAGGSQHRIDGLRHFRGGILGICAVASVRQEAAELGAVGNHHLCKGEDGGTIRLFPGDSGNGIIQIEVHHRAGQLFPVISKIQLLPPQQRGGLLLEPVQVGNLHHLAVAVRIGRGSNQVAVIELFGLHRGLIVLPEHRRLCRHRLVVFLPNIGYGNFHRCFL